MRTRETKFSLAYSKPSIILLIVITLGLAMMLGSQRQQFLIFLYIIDGVIIAFMFFYKREKKDKTGKKEEPENLKIEDK